MITLPAILAQTQYAKKGAEFGSAFKRAHAQGPDWRIIFALTAVFLAVVLALLITRRIRRKQSGELFAQKPYRLFSYVLKELGVGFSDRLLVRWAARKCSLRQPAVMLFNPDLMERTVGHWADSLRIGLLRRHARDRLNALAAKAFA